MAILCFAGIFLMARVCFAPGFVIACASSRIRQSHVMPESASIRAAIP
jgi:hypothetical protein